MNERNHRATIKKVLKQCVTLEVSKKLTLHNFLRRRMGAILVYVPTKCAIAEGNSPEQWHPSLF